MFDMQNIISFYENCKKKCGIPLIDTSKNNRVICIQYIFLCMDIIHRIQCEQRIEWVYLKCKQIFLIYNRYKIYKTINCKCTITTKVWCQANRPNQNYCYEYYVDFTNKYYKYFIKQLNTKENPRVYQNFNLKRFYGFSF